MVERGLLAGAAGTALMTAWQSLMSRSQSSSSESVEGEHGEGQDPWAEAPAPAQVGKRLIEGVFRTEVAAERIPLLTSVMHWGYGTVLGGMYALTQSSLRPKPLSTGCCSVQASARRRISSSSRWDSTSRPGSTRPGRSRRISPTISSTGSASPAPTKHWADSRERLRREMTTTVVLIIVFCSSSRSAPAGEARGAAEGLEARRAVRAQADSCPSPWECI
jgi:hypothetical protein